MSIGSSNIRVGSLRHTFWARSVVAPFVLLAFLVQALIVQTHVHVFAAGIATQTSASRSADSNDTALCPLCQAAISGGTYLIPNVVAAACAAALRTYEPLTPYLIVALAASYTWQSRAPPARR
jgi:hypothetical protein